MAQLPIMEKDFRTTNMKIYLTAREGSQGLMLYEAWKGICGNLKFVEIYRGSILDLKCDAVVSPANSFGFMDGGVDGVYTRHFGTELQRMLQDRIKHYHDGELLVGEAIAVETGNKDIPWLISAPTMRVPMVLDSESVNPYLAARAALRLARFYDIKSIAFPGMGTGVGRVSPLSCARQVRAAIQHVLIEKPKFPTSWKDASIQHQYLFIDEARDLQYEPGEMGSRYGNIIDRKRDRK